MDSSRTEYPALLATLQPDQAISVLDDRVRLISKVNNNIADWLQERRRVEEAYVQGLRKLAKRPQQDDATSLGIFQMPWQRIVSGTENIAASHETLAKKIETDVEMPLRQFQSQNLTMRTLANSQVVLAEAAKNLTSAQKKSEKWTAKAGKKDGSGSMAEAAREWEAQAPQVFEQLQTLDEARVAHLRDVLTQFQTHEVDQVERNRTSAESCLNALLNIETADEIKTFAARISTGPPIFASRRSSTATSVRPQSAHLQVPPTPPPPRQSGGSSGQDKSTLQDSTPHKSKLGGLKRLGTVMSRRKSAAPPPPPVPVSTSEKSEKRKEKGRSFAPFRRGDSSRSFQDLDSTGQDLTPVASQVSQGSAAQRQTSYTAPAAQSRPEQSINGPSAMINGTSQSPQETFVKTQTPPLDQGIGMASTPQPEQATPSKSTGISPVQESPATSTDPFTRAQQDTAFSNTEGDDSSRNFAIRDKPIREDETEAQRAMNNMASQLRMQAQTSGTNRVQGSVRGRRDVRNTMFFHPGEGPTIPGISNAASSGGFGMGAPAAVTPSATSDTASPMLRAVARTASEDHVLGSDSTSIHSAHSLMALTHHPDMHESGLNASIIETVNTWFSETGVSKSFVTGEIALAYNPTAQSIDHEEIRLQNFQVLEKVAANPMFVTESKGTNSIFADDQAGCYTVNLSAIKKASPTVGLKYQLHMDETNLAQYSPVLITPAWQVVEGQASIIILYSLNPIFSSAGADSITLKNAVISVTLDISGDAPKPTSAMMAPTQGASFKRKAGAVVWRLNDLVVKSTQDRLLVRFLTPGAMAKKGTIDVKFEIQGRNASAIGVERQGAGPATAREADPFADEGEASDRGSAEVKRWEAVPTKRAIMTGRYTAG